MKGMMINFIYLLKKQMNKNSIIIISLFVILISCKKKDVTTVSSTGTSTATGGFGYDNISNPFFSADFGSCMDNEHLPGRQLSYLSTNHLIVSSVNYDTAYFDKLQISKIGVLGNFIWQKTLSSGEKHYSGQAFETSTGDIIAIGGVSKPLSSWTDSKVFIAKLNPATGDTVWTRKYGYSYIDHGIVGYEALDHNYWIVDFYHQNGRATLLKIAPNGDSLTSVFNTGGDHYSTALVTANKKIVMVGQAGSITAYICKYTDGIKDFENSFSITGYTTAIVNNVCETTDGGFVIVGNCYNPAMYAPRYGFLIKVDVNGNKLWERVLTQFDGSEITACVEAGPDKFILAIGRYGSGTGQLLKYNLSDLVPLVNAGYQFYSDSQLLLNSNSLYRVMLYGNVRVKLHTVY